MRVLVVSNMFPTEEDPVAGTFVATQVDALRSTGVDVELLVTDRVRLGRRSYLGASSEIRRVTRRGDFDVVHCRYGGLISAATVVGVAGRVPVVTSFCGSDVLGEPELGVVRGASASVGVWSSRWAARRSAHCIVMSANLRDVVAGWVPATRISIILDGVDLDRFVASDKAQARETLGWSPEGVHVLFGGRSTPTKRPELARAAVAELRSQGVHVELHMPEGTGPDGMPMLMNASDALLFTSAREGSPNMVREALACDLPVVSVDVGDVRERLAGLEGCHVVDDSADALAQALEATLRMAGRPPLRQAVQGLSALDQARKVVGVYSEVIRSQADASDAHDRR